MPSNDELTIAVQEYFSEAQLLRFRQNMLTLLLHVRREKLNGQTSLMKDLLNDLIPLFTLLDKLDRLT